VVVNQSVLRLLKLGTQMARVMTGGPPEREASRSDANRTGNT
jgi:hypothetical protein